MFPQLVVDAQENVTALPVAQSSGAAVRTIIYSVSVTGLQVGDIVNLQSQFEVTNGLGFNVTVTRYLTRGASATDTAGTVVIPAAGETISPALHHEVCVLVGTDQITVAGNYFYNVVAYANSSAAQAGNTVEVMQHYGKLWAVVYRQNS